MQCFVGLLSTGRLNLAKLLVAKHQSKCKFAKKLPVGMQPVIEVRGSMYLGLVLSPSRRRIRIRWSLSSGWDWVLLCLISAQNLTKSQTILKPQDSSQTTFFVLPLTISLLSLNLGQTRWPIISRTHCNFLLTGFCLALLTWDAFPLHPIFQMKWLLQNNLCLGEWLGIDEKKWKRNKTTHNLKIS